MDNAPDATLSQNHFTTPKSNSPSNSNFSRTPLLKHPSILSQHNSHTHTLAVDVKSGTHYCGFPMFPSPWNIKNWCRFLCPGRDPQWCIHQIWDPSAFSAAKFLLSNTSFFSCVVASNSLNATSSLSFNTRSSLKCSTSLFCFSHASCQNTT